MSVHHLLLIVLAGAACGPARQAESRAEPPPDPGTVERPEEQQRETAEEDQEESVVLVVQDQEGEPLADAWLEALPSQEGIFFADAEGRISVPKEVGVLISLAAPGFAMEDDLGPVAPKTLLLERCPWVELTVPDHVPLPEHPHFLAVGLAEETPRGFGVAKTAGIDLRGPAFDLYFRFGDDRRVRIAAPDVREPRVEWYLVTDTGSGASHRRLQQERQRITLDGSLDVQSFEVAPTPSAIEEALRAADED